MTAGAGGCPARSAPPLRDLSRLSLNQITIEQWSLAEAVEACAGAGVPWLGVWRHKLEPLGAARSAELIRRAGIRVSSLLRAGFFPAATEAERRAREDDNRRAVDEAAELDAGVLVLVCGPAPDSDLRRARAMVEEGLAQLVPYARERGVKLAIEPLHPMMAAERSVVVTLEQANRLASSFDPDEVGVVVDAYHVWWDPRLEAQLAAAQGRILGYHVSDWLVPTTDLLAGRGLMGDGVIDLRGIRAAVEAAGYRGPIEVEIINSDLRDLPGDGLFRRVIHGYLTYA